MMAQPYLCQVSRRVSCGACCGLYNIHNLSRNRLEAMLATRTAAFDLVPRQAGAIEDFGQRQLGWAPEDRPFPHFYHCPYIGLIGRERTRVGCLLHPEASGNHGRDWRELSYYGAKACQNYFCPSTKQLRAEHQDIIRTGIDHWYLYGLTITEHRLWSAFFRELEYGLGRHVIGSDFDEGPEARRRLRRFATLKLNWPYRRSEVCGPCNDFFDDESDPRTAVDRVDPTIPISSYEVIFGTLQSRFMGAADLQRAEAMVETILDELTAIVGP